MKRFPLVLTTLALGLLLVGCSKENTGVAPTDEEAIQELLFSQYADWVDITDTYEGDSTETHLTSRDTLQGLVAWWRRHFWHEQIRDLNIHIQNDTAWVILYREIPGRLNLLVRMDTTFPETVVRYVKPLTDHSERRLLFVRTGPPTAPPAAGNCGPCPAWRSVRPRPPCTLTPCGSPAATTTPFSPIPWHSRNGTRSSPLPRARPSP